MSEADAGTWTVRRLLEWTVPFFTSKNVDSPRLSAELLLAHVLNIPRIRLYTDYERPADPNQLAAFRDLVKRAVEEEPIAYLTGRAHFFNLEFEVTRDVLIPRPDTETLVENAIQLLRHEPSLENPRILDLCAGSGNIAAAIAQNVKQSVVVATELSPATVSVARRNIERLALGDRVTILEGDLFAPLAARADKQPFHMLLANPPYIRSDQIAHLDRSVREYEPVAALDGGPDGLAFHRRILTQAPEYLVPGASILLEIAYDQAEAAKIIASEHPQFGEVRILKDHAGNSRVLALRLKK
jgi:release factor glutamine methyltransferase